MENVLFPSSVSQINNFSFEFCDSLKNVEFPKNSQLESISSYLFYYSLLKRIKIPAKVKKIGLMAFFGLPKLEKVEFS